MQTLPNADNNAFLLFVCAKINRDSTLTAKRLTVNKRVDSGITTVKCKCNAFILGVSLITLHQQRHTVVMYLTSGSNF